MLFPRRKPCRCLIEVCTIVVTLIALGSPTAAHAQSDAARGIVRQFVGISGYWFTDSTAKSALGTPKFAGDTVLHFRPAHRAGMLISGGAEFVSASDHWQPFSGGNSFSLSGASFRISGERVPGRVLPFVTGGIFEGHINSEIQNFREDKIVPSVAVGAEYKVLRYLTVTARYRASGHMRGVNTDGFSLGLKLF